MSSELDELDQLIESDILEALGEEIPEELKQETTTELVEPDDLTNIPDGYLDETEIPFKDKVEESIETEEIESEGEVLDDIGDIEILPMAEIESALEDEENEPIVMNSADAGSLAEILSKLLNNKTIEITIKVKD